MSEFKLSEFHGNNKLSLPSPKSGPVVTLRYPGMFLSIEANESEDYQIIDLFLRRANQRQLKAMFQR